MQERNLTVIEEFRRRRQRQLAVSVPLVLLIVAIAWFGEHKTDTIAGLPASVLMGAAFALVLGAVVFSFQNWRCPSCNGYLGKAISPRFCSKCGAALS